MKTASYRSEQNTAVSASVNAFSSCASMTRTANLTDTAFAVSVFVFLILALCLLSISIISLRLSLIALIILFAIIILDKGIKRTRIQFRKVPR